MFINAAFHTSAVNPFLHKLYKKETSIYLQVFLVPDSSLNWMKYLFDTMNRTLTLVAPRIPKDNFQFCHNSASFCHNSYPSCYFVKLEGSENRRYVQITKATSLGHLVVEKQLYMPSGEIISKNKFVILSLLGTECHLLLKYIS